MKELANQLKQFIRRTVPVSDAEFDEWMQLATVEKYKKGSYFVRIGEVCNKTGFLVKGIARTHLLNQAGEEVTRRIALEPATIADYESFAYQTPSRTNIQFVEDSLLLIISKEMDVHLLEKSPTYNTFRRINIEGQFIAVLRILERFLDETAEMRYQRILDQQPRLLQRVPLQYIASLIGVTPTQLSRIRKKISP